jgi:hypothetical protein
LTGLGGVVLVSTIVLALVILASFWLMGKASARLVGDKHKILEGIIETGQVPGNWRVRHERRITRLTKNPADAASLAASQEQARLDYLRRLDELVRYVQTSALVDGDETRTLLLSRLAAVRANWEGKLE